LLFSGIQIEQGLHRGGVAGWLDAHGEPEFLYPEIAGYYMTTSTWLASGAATTPERAADALERGQLAMDWIRRVVDNDDMPPTRLYLSSERSDWRNSAVFSFDLCMVVRGISCFESIVGSNDARDLVERLCTTIRRICSDMRLMRSHIVLSDGTELPRRWSTLPGPHHLKAAASVLKLPRDVVGDALAGVCRRTCDTWEARMHSHWPCRELHALLYGFEGMLIDRPVPADSVEPTFERLLRLQAPDGTLPALMDATDPEVRSDVLAQALRIGTWLRDGGVLDDDHWSRALEGLASALLLHVQPDGAVLFSRDGRNKNAWCAMFALQALCTYRDNSNGVRLGSDHASTFI
jgi:hypothetical protein